MKVVGFWISPLLIHASTFQSDEELDETSDHIPLPSTDDLTSMLAPHGGHVGSISGLRGAHPTHDMSVIDLSTPQGIWRSGKSCRIPEVVLIRLNF